MEINLVTVSSLPLKALSSRAKDKQKTAKTPHSLVVSWVPGTLILDLSIMSQKKTKITFCFILIHYHTIRILKINSFPENQANFQRKRVSSTWCITDGMWSGVYKLNFYEFYE